MRFQNREFTILELLELVNDRRIDLQPPYQRNFIWTNKDQQLLIDSILKGYPLPSFFVYKKNDKKYVYEMVDGQQRAETISRFAKGLIKSSDKKSINDINKESFLSYRLNFVELSEINDNESVEEYYYLVNKRGVPLNPNETNKAYYYNSAFINLVNELMSIQDYIDLDIFSEKSISRMNDRGLVEELVSYLFRGITDKRTAVENLFESEKEVNDGRDCVKKRFEVIVKKLLYLNEIKPINQTRFAQRNDFYTLFTFVNETIDNSEELLKYQYSILLFLDSYKYISPSNDECEPFKNYAINCVSQSNSKNARSNRLTFLKLLLLNEDVNDNEILKDIQAFLEKKYFLTSFKWKNIQGYQLIDIDQFIK
ncbi:MAG: DUF262 domain-containing protein [Parabacteroides sp.]|nr:DUF262 domain-containing protein [Parabacteroides sp.]